jgi:arylsulfatase A-like enzyme
MIVVDTLRADHLGCLGDPMASTPHIDSLAERGIRFTDVTTPVPVTLPAVSSLLTGRFPFRHGVRDNEGFSLPEEEVTLAERFRSAGWRTAAVLGSAVLSRDRGLARGFEIYDDEFTGPYVTYERADGPLDNGYGETRRRADIVTEKALRAVEEFDAGDSVFLLVHYFDVHARYDPPPRFAALVPGHPYAGEVSFVDEQVGRLLAELADQDPTVVLVADHGEGLGEHGEAQHGFLLYESTLQVPWIVAGPGIPGGLTRHDAVSLIDVEPTLAAWFRLPPAGPRRDGRALQWDHIPAEPPVLYAETMRTMFSYGWSERRAVRYLSGKFVAGPPDELYDLDNDPYELRDLAGRSDVETWRGLLEEVTEGETRADVLALPREELDPARRARLESLGYTGGTGPTEGELPHPREALTEWTRLQEHKTVLFRALYALASGRWSEGEKVLDTLLAGAPDLAEGHYARAVARWGRGDRAGAQRSLSICLRLNPSFAPALALSAEREGRIGDALEHWTDSLAEVGQAVADPMLILAQPTPFPEGFRSRLEVLELDASADDDGRPRLERAIVELRLGLRSEARNTIRDLLRRPPVNPDADVDGILVQLEKFFGGR